MVKAVIFDMDGVIVDTEKYHEKAYQNTANKLGVKITQKEVMQFKGVTATEIFKYLFNKHRITESVVKYALIKDEVYRSYLTNLKPLSGVIDLINKLKKDKIKLAIASSGSKLNVEFILRKLKIKNKFNVIVNGEDVKKGKPDPELFLTAAKKLGIRPKECIVIEDAVSGVNAAKKAGMFCIAVTGTFVKSKLKDADLVINRLSELKV